MIKHIFFVIFIISCNYSNPKRTIKTKADSIADIIKLYEPKADYYLSHKNYPRALECLNNLIEADSTNGKYYFMRGKAYMNLYSLDLSTEDYLKAASLKYREADSYFDIGLNNMFYNDSIAIVYFNKALQLNPHDLSAIEEKEDCEKRIKLTPIKKAR